MPKVSFTHTQSPFFNILKGKVNHYFASRQLDTSGSRPLLIKSIIQVCTAVTLYAWLVFFNPGVWTSVVLCVLFGMNLALIGFNIMHEGGHQSFSKHKWLNETSAYFLNVLGGNAYYWKIKHNINHHTYTNIEGMDSDIDVKPFMRLNENQPRYALHRFQHLYWIGLYGISYVVWVFYHDFEKYFTGKIAANAGAYTLDAKEHTIFWITKLAYVIVYIALPIIMLGPLQALVGFAIATFVCGTFISVVFQLAHVVEGTVFPVPNEQSNKIEDEWAIHQVKTTANFATNSKVVSWLLGGLNFQVEHHLFPKISHIHYPAINKLVKETCEEFNITYLEHASVLKAFRSHMHFIKRLGTA